ncbi:MAG: hypothetical protein P4M09_26895 [Devosia sp.]|nr:hypothetical protein [Devosia sp.]
MGIPLSQVLSELRNEMTKARLEGENSTLRFSVEEINVDLQVVITTEGGADGSIKFLVVEAKAGVHTSMQNTQRISVKLKPFFEVEGEVPVNFVSDTEKLRKIVLIPADVSKSLAAEAPKEPSPL